MTAGNRFLPVLLLLTALCALAFFVRRRMLMKKLDGQLRHASTLPETKDAGDDGGVCLSFNDKQEVI